MENMERRGDIPIRKVSCMKTWHESCIQENDISMHVNDISMHGNESFAPKNAWMFLMVFALKYSW